MKKKDWTEKKAEQKEKIEQLCKQLTEGVENFEYSPEFYAAILKMKALMPNYSFKNLLLAKSQMPDVTFLASFKRWKQLGRNVKKGESSIRIFAPVFGKDKKNEDENVFDEHSDETVLKGFYPAPVFDVSQTEGEPLPLDKYKLRLEGESEETSKIIDAAEKIIAKDECTLSYGNTSPANGYYSPDRHEIKVSDTLTLNGRCKTLVHELVHMKVHRNSTATRTEQEIVAEGVAYIICNFFGLDTSDYSFRYVKSWSDEDNGETVMKYGTDICSIAGTVIKEFESLMEQEEDELHASA